jgi:hypothetical protein
MTEFEKMDLDGDGHVSKEEYEIYLDKLRREIEDDDNKRDQIRKMVWWCLFPMIFYPLFITITGWMGMDKSAGLIADIAPTYFMAVAAVIGSFFGADAYVKGKDKSKGEDK